MAGHGHPSYLKVLVWLLILFVISAVGPEIGAAVGSRTLTLFTAFGIAGVKAYLVLKYFMHVNVEKTYISYLLVTALGLMFLFFAAVAPDVMNHEGQNWENIAAKAEVERREAEHAAGGGAGHH
jgi:caa(3)-type oxidase subunit IV